MKILKDFLTGIITVLLLFFAGYLVIKFWYVPLGALLLFSIYMTGKSFRENGYRL